MRNSVFLFIVGVLTATKEISCKNDIFAVKCCGPDEELNSYFMACNKLWDTTLEYTNEPSDSSETAENSMYTVENGTTIVIHEDTNFTEYNWLPEMLRRKLGKGDVVQFGGMKNYKKSQTLRLQTPRDSYRFTLFPNGSLILYSNTVLDKHHISIFEPTEYCMDTYTDDETSEQESVVLLCPCSRVNCVKKCCHIGEAMICDGDDCNCFRSDSVWHPFYQDLPSPSQDFPYEIIKYDFWQCSSYYSLYFFDDLPQFLIHRFWSETLKDGYICGDVFEMEGRAERYGFRKCDPYLPYTYIFGLLNSLHGLEGIVLAVTLLVNFVVPRKRLSAYAYIHDFSLNCHVAALLVRNVLFIAKSCTAIPFFVYFFSMAASFWLNVLCLNMTFGFWKPLGVQGSQSGRSKKMLLIYSLYAWGASSAMTGFTSAMWYSREVPEGLLRPTLHETKICYKEIDGDGKMATFAYYYGPVTALLCVNAILFLSIALRVRALRQDRAMLSDSASTGTDCTFSNKHSVMVYIKILWLMGVIEMAMEFVSWIVNNNDHYYTIACSVLDLIRAAAIFYVSCCKRQTMLSLLHLHRACAMRLSQRWCCKQRENTETNLKDVGVRYAKNHNDVSNMPEGTMADPKGVSKIE